MNNPSKAKKAAYAAFAALGLTMGAAGLAAAATNQAPPASTSPTVTQDKGVEAPGGADESPSYKSSVSDPAGAAEADGTETSDAAEAAKLQALAKITPAEAKSAALAAVPGTADKVELESENGNVVYGVEVTTSSGSVDVKVDAGNGKVLSQQKDDAGDEKESGPEDEKESGPEQADKNEPAEGAETGN